ncbi:unnamed protein product [Closterium sp. NIES-53]
MPRCPALHATGTTPPSSLPFLLLFPLHLLLPFLLPPPSPHLPASHLHGYPHCYPRCCRQCCLQHSPWPTESCPPPHPRLPPPLVPPTPPMHAPTSAKTRHPIRSSSRPPPDGRHAELASPVLLPTWLQEGGEEKDRQMKVGREHHLGRRTR